jgi:hypothetical protein
MKTPLQKLKETLHQRINNLNEKDYDDWTSIKAFEYCLELIEVLMLEENFSKKLNEIDEQRNSI